MALCDEEILGKVFREGEIILDVSPNFYQGEKVGLEEAIKAIREADIAVITGKRIISKLAEIGLIDEDFALKIEGQPHLQIVKEVLE